MHHTLSLRAVCFDEVEYRQLVDEVARLHLVSPHDTEDVLALVIVARCYGFSVRDVANAPTATALELAICLRQASVLLS